VPITRLNHAVLYVRDAERSAAFYSDVLGFRTVMAMPGAVFLQAPASTNDHDLGLFTIGEAAGASGAGRQTVGLYHLAWEVDTLSELQRVADALSGQNALVGASDHGTTKALYAHDPDGIEFEVSWLVPLDLRRRDARRPQPDRPSRHRQGDRALRRRDPRRRRRVDSRHRLTRSSGGPRPQGQVVVGAARAAIENAAATGWRRSFQMAPSKVKCSAPTVNRMAL
jgi:catechol 2,3-dioxygenase-like lactoylglutathione lyase family enzyme